MSTDQTYSFTDQLDRLQICSRVRGSTHTVKSYTSNRELSAIGAPRRTMIVGAICSDTGNKASVTSIECVVATDDDNSFQYLPAATLAPRYDSVRNNLDFVDITNMFSACQS